MTVRGSLFVWYAEMGLSFMITKTLLSGKKRKTMRLTYKTRASVGICRHGETRNQSKKGWREQHDIVPCISSRISPSLQYVAHSTVVGE